MSYASIAVLTLSILSVGHRSDQSQSAVFGAVSALAEDQTASIDQVAAATVAAEVAETTDITVKPHVVNLSTSLNARAALAQSSQDFASKPLMLSDDLENIASTYKVKRGDTIAQIAADHGVSAQTVKWANDIDGDAVAVGSTLRIPTVNGVIHTVEQGDTAASLAKKYKASKESIISFNNAELSGLKAGATIIIPGGILPENERPGYEAPTSSYNSGYNSGYSPAQSTPFTPSYSVGYPFGWCTYYAAAQTGAPGNWGNANTWDDYAVSTPGWTVSGAPVAGAIAQTDFGGGGYGHVAVVKAVSSDGTMIKYSDMNGLAGWGAVGSSGWVPVSHFQTYIYR